MKTIKRLILIVLLFASPCLATNLTQNLVNWELNASATAADVNGGGFDWGNVSFLTNLACTTSTGNTPDCSSASITFIQADALHWVFVKSGTHWAPGWYYITDACVSSVWQPANSGACTTGHIRMNAAAGAAVQQNTTVGLPSPAYVANTTAGMSNDATASLTSGTFGVDYSQATAAITNDTDLGCTSTACTSVGHPMGPRLVGNVLHITTTGTGAHCVVGWYEILSDSTTTATLDRDPTTGGACVLGTFYVGGAMSLGNALDPTVFAQGYATSLTGANRFFVKNGSYTLGATLTGLTVGLIATPIVVEGYNALRGDTPAGANRPTIATGTYNFSPANYWDVYNLILTTTSTGVPAIMGTGSKFVNVKAVNSGTTVAHNAITGASNAFLWNCEAISYRGNALALAAGFTIRGCYFHDSNVGITVSTTAGGSIIDTIIESNMADAIIETGASTAPLSLDGCTLYGGENKTGIGVSLYAGSAMFRILNTIIYGFTTGISHADAGQTSGYDDYNDYYNNTASQDTANWQKGIHDLALNPTFTSVAQHTGSGASTTTGTLTDAAVDFTTYGIVGNQDFVNITADTGSVTLGQYLITSVASTHVLNLSPAPGTLAAVAYQITTGRNFAIGTPLKAGGFPGAFPAGIFTGYLDIGAVQRQEPAAGGGQHNTGFVQ
jgi:hypothetical protein